MDFLQRNGESGTSYVTIGQVQRLSTDVTNLNVFTSQATSEPVLDPQQIQAFDQLCHLYRGSSRVMFVWLNFYFFIYNCYFGNVVSLSPLKSTLLWPCGALAPGSNQNLAKDAKEVERCLPLTYLEL